MILSKVSKRYARALFQLAQEKGSQEQIYRDLKVLGQAIEQSTDFDSFLQNPD